jgi:sugar phosphate isomerase/epimerase
MPNRTLDIGVVTDEVARSLAEALEVGAAWGLERFELREGAEGRFPFFTQHEIHLVEEALRRGHRITAVSPGLFKGHVEDQKQREHELDNVLPRAIDLARHFECPLLISFSFAKYDGEPAANRVLVLRAFERVAETAAEAGMVVALENEPDFWIDRPAESVALLEELGHPALRINWDPANLHWGGMVPAYEGFEVLQPYLANLHVKDFTPHDAVVPWRPLGQGTTPWGDILAWILEETNLAHVTLETHCEPLLEQTQASLAWLQATLETIEAALG